MTHRVARGNGECALACGGRRAEKGPWGIRGIEDMGGHGRTWEDMGRGNAGCNDKQRQMYGADSMDSEPRVRCKL